MCCICCGELTPENALYEDLGEGRGGVHRGPCAIHAGFVPDEHREEWDRLIRHLHNCAHGSDQHRAAIIDVYSFADAISTENHEWEGPAMIVADDYVEDEWYADA